MSAIKRSKRRRQSKLSGMMTKRFSNCSWQKVSEIFILLILLLEIDPVWMRAQTGSLPGDILHQEDQLVVNHFTTIISSLFCLIEIILIACKTVNLITNNCENFYFILFNGSSEKEGWKMKMNSERKLTGLKIVFILWKISLTTKSSMSRLNNS